MASNAPAYLAAGVAGVAAILSAVNVALSSRLSRSNDFHRWRRDVLLPGLIRFIEVVDVCLDAARARADTDSRQVPEHDRQPTDAEAEEAVRELTYSNAYLELVASPDVRTAARELRAALLTANLTSKILADNSRMDSTREDWRRDLALAMIRREDFLVAARENLGIPPTELLDARISAIVDDLERDQS